MSRNENIDNGEQKGRLTKSPKSLFGYWFAWQRFLLNSILALNYLKICIYKIIVYKQLAWISTWLLIQYSAHRQSQQLVDLEQKASKNAVPGWRLTNMQKCPWAFGFQDSLNIQQDLLTWKAKRLKGLGDVLLHAKWQTLRGIGKVGNQQAVATSLYLDFPWYQNIFSSFKLILRVWDSFENTNMKIFGDHSEREK